MASPRKPRRRLDADAARALILDVTEKRLIQSGVAGIRLQDVAADAGVSHPTVLHHFGSRAHLVKAVVSRALRAINESLVEAIGASAGDEGRLEGILEGVARVFAETGHARVILWLALEGHRIESAEARLSDVVDATHALRKVHGVDGKRASRDDTARTVVLAALALIGGPVIGQALMENAGMKGDRLGEDFRRWLARLLLQHMQGVE